MMKIDINNYESFFIDYLDGNLPLGEIDLLLDFLTENPGLAEELKGLEKIKLQPSSQTQNNFNHLKKSDLDLAEIFEETCIRALENDLSTKEYLDFQEYLKLNNEHKKTYEMFQLTVFEPDPLIRFDKKHSLRKREKGFVFRYWYAAAAVIILGLMLFIPHVQEPIVSSEHPIAKQVEIKVSTPIEVNEKIQLKSPVITVKKHTYIAENKIVQEIATEGARTKEIIEPLTPFIAIVKYNSDFNQKFDLIAVADFGSEPGKDYSKYQTINELIAQKVDKIKEEEKNGFFGKVVLNMVKKVSGDKFDYTTTKKGKINTFEFNSKLLAFTIPIYPSQN